VFEKKEMWVGEGLNGVALGVGVEEMRHFNGAAV